MPIFHNAKMIQIVRWLLFPFSIIYDIVTRVRNRCFNLGIFKSSTYQIPVICIGNITIGGTGKTPHTEYLAKLLLPNFRVTMISRGYKRLTKGVVVASQQSKASDIGDEPFQIHQKFGNINVVAAEKRALGIEAAMQFNPPPEVILLDDAYQHRHVKAGLNILLIDYNRPIWNDYLIPTGNLRESASGIERAHMVIITKCPPALNNTDRLKWVSKMQRIDPEKIFFSFFKYGKPYSLINSNNALTISDQMSALLLTGIANPTPLQHHLESMVMRVTPITFADHHLFSDADIQHVSQKFDQLFGQNKIIITTEKDAVRLREMNNLPQNIVNNTWVIPIEVDFLFNQNQKFNALILKYARQDDCHQ